MTIGNSNFEEWLNQNPDKDYNEFKFDFKKMSASGSLFDLENIDIKEYLKQIPEVFYLIFMLVNWTHVETHLCNL